MNGMQVYVQDADGLRKIGAVVPTWNEANLIVGIYPDVCRSVGHADKLGAQKFFALCGDEFYEFTPLGWKVVP